MNVVVLKGTLSRTPVERVLASGSTLTTFEVTTRPPGEEGRATSVPVAWFDGSHANLDEGDDVVVVGEVQRRFFRSAAGLQSRTEVVASIVARPRQRKALERALLAAEDCLAAVIGK